MTSPAGKRGSIERELKFREVELDRLRQRLVEMEAERVQPGTFEENWLLDNDGQLAERGCVLRLRKDSRGATLTFKGPPTFDGTTKVREEFETSISDVEATRSLLGRLGYELVKSYQKVRETWQIGAVAISLDHTPIGDFAEFEGEGAERLASRCDLDPATAERRSYLRLYQDYLVSHPDAPADMTFTDR